MHSIEQQVGLFVEIYESPLQIGLQLTFIIVFVPYLIVKKVIIDIINEIPSVTVSTCYSRLTNVNTNKFTNTGTLTEYNDRALNLL